MDYAEYLPHIDVEDGKARIMGNMQLYKKLLKRFNGKQLIDSLLEVMDAGDMEQVYAQAHALKGVAGNLSFSVLREVVFEIEKRCKAKMDLTCMRRPLLDSWEVLEGMIKKIVE